MPKNIDEDLVQDFGKEWSQFDQSAVPPDELLNAFQQYFSLLSWDKLPGNSEGFDLGCGSGRWAYFCARRVGKLHCIDLSKAALDVAQKKLSSFKNCFFHIAGADNMPLEDNSMDFGYSLGVLHHLPDTAAGISSCVKKLKPRAPLLLYIYYAFDNRPPWYRAIWRISDILRRVVSVMPFPIKHFVSQLIALIVYFPLARLAARLELRGVDVSHFPLSSYRNKSLYTLRTDALDRFGTRLEQRFTRSQIKQMMIDAGLVRIEFRNKEPFWCAIGYKAA